MMKLLGIRSLQFVVGISSVLLAGCQCTKPVLCNTPPVVIDAHSHLFNANYLPVREICISRGVPRLAAEAIEIIVLFLTGDSHLGEVDAKAETRARDEVQATA